MYHSMGENGFDFSFLFSFFYDSSSYYQNEWLKLNMLWHVASIGHSDTWHLTVPPFSSELLTVQSYSYLVWEIILFHFGIIIMNYLVLILEHQFSPALSTYGSQTWTGIRTIVSLALRPSNDAIYFLELLQPMMGRWWDFSTFIIKWANTL